MRVAGTTLVLFLAFGASAQIPIPADSVSTVGTSAGFRSRGSLGGLTSDALGFLYMANFREAVWRIDLDGTAKLLTESLYGSSGNAIDAQGYLYQSNFNANTISRVRRDGRVEEYASEGLNGPVGLKFDADGDLYVCNCSGGTISRVQPDGRVEEFARSPLLACPNGITQDEDGNFVVVNFNSPDVLKIDREGKVAVLAQVGGAGGNGHITTLRGNFYITQPRGNAVYRLTPAGEVSLVAGDGTRESLDGPADVARFSFPNGITVSGNDLYVNDLHGPQGTGQPTTIVLRRIQLTTLDGVLSQLAEGLEPNALAEQLDAQLAAYREARPWDDTRADAIRVGYRFLSSGRFQAALKLFAANAEQYPEDANSQYHFGEACRYTGQTDQAIRQYERVLELEPDFPQAAERLALVKT